MKPFTCAFAGSLVVSILIVVTLLSLSLFRLTDEIEDRLFSLSISSCPFPFSSAAWNGLLASMGNDTRIDLSFSLEWNVPRKGFVDILIVGEVIAAVVIIVIMSSANGLLLMVVLVIELSTFGELWPLMALEPVVTGTLIFSTTPPWMSEKCVTVTLSFLFAFFSIGVGIRGTIDGMLHTFGVVGEGKRRDDAAEVAPPPFKFSVSLSPPCCTTIHFYTK